MIDTHCHLDYFEDPLSAVEAARVANVTIICVTNSPLAFERAYPHVKSLPNVRLAVGMHPLEAEQCIGQWKLFEKCLARTSYVGEVGLDFSSIGAATKDVQTATFSFILRSINAQPKFVTIHSRKAESAVLELLEENGSRPAVFHWYTGSVRNLERALSLGHYFSVNAAMLRTKKGQKLIEAMPFERVLLETDAPFAKVQGKPTRPGDVQLVAAELKLVWGKELDQVEQVLRQNMWTLLSRLGITQSQSRLRSHAAD